VPEPHAGSLSSSGIEFQTVGPAIENARRPYVLRRQGSLMTQPTVTKHWSRVVADIYIQCLFSRPY